MKKAVIFIKAVAVAYISMLALLALGGYDLLKALHGYVQHSVAGLPAYEDMLSNMRSLIYGRLYIFAVLALVLSILSVLKISGYFKEGETGQKD